MADNNRRMLDVLKPEWRAPANVNALVTTRTGGHSSTPFDQFNLAMHVEDDPARVLKNRAWLVQACELPAEPVWLQQVHGVQVVRAELAGDDQIADAVTTSERGVVCAIMTADCLPVLFCDKAGSQVAAAHAGWRGLVSGVLETTRNTFVCASEDILVWLGPAIGPQAFEVGDEVRTAYLEADPELASAFVPGETSQGSEKKWYLDIYAAARIRLRALGIDKVSGGEFCTYTDQERFYSYRRDKRTGRMASLIWLDQKT